MHLFLLCFTLIHGQDIYLNFKSENDTVYKDGKVQDKFNPNILDYGQTCNPPQSFSISEAKSNFGQTNQTLQIFNVGDSPFVASVIQEENNDVIETSTEEILGSTDSFQFLLKQKCPAKEKLDSHNYWAAITVKVMLIYSDKTVIEPFVIVFSCDKSFRALTFDWSLVILLVISTTLIAFLAKHTRIQSFRWKWNGLEFQGFPVNYSVLSIYLGVYLIGAGIILGSGFVKVANYSLIITACILGTFGIFFAASEVACLGKAGSWVRRYRIVVATSVTILISVPYFFFQPWYLSDIMSMTFIFMIVKFFRLKNFKFATILMALNVTMDVMVSLLVHYTQDISYNTLALKNLNCPLELQLPLISLQFNKNCAWIALFSQAIPGLILSLAYRLDESKRTFAYGLAGFCSLIFAEGLWILTTVSVAHSIPQTVFTYPILLFTLALISFRRAEFKSFWHGDYLTDFDYYRTKIRGDSLQDVPKLRLLSGSDSIPEIRQQASDT